MSYFRTTVFILFVVLIISCQTREHPTYITVHAFYEQKDQMDVVILDVRTQVEIEQGYIEGAVFIDYFDENFQQELETLDRDKEYLVYCKSGGRSNDAAVRMLEMGFKKVYDLEGGIIAWMENGYEMK